MFETFADRITKTESDFLGHLQKVEGKLDQLVDLTKTVAVLQEQTARHADVAAELRTTVRDTSAKNDASITRLHTRIDEVQGRHRAEMDGVKHAVNERLLESHKKAEEVDAELKKWLNRGWGVWTLATLICVLSGGMFYRWVDTIDRDRQAVVQVLDMVKTEGATSKQQLDTLTKISSDLTEMVRRNDQRMNDAERRLDAVTGNYPYPQHPRR